MRQDFEPAGRDGRRRTPLFVDAKYVEPRDGERLRPAAIYVVGGLDTDSKETHPSPAPTKIGRISRTGKHFYFPASA